MNIDKGLIKHWAMLFESEEARMNGSMSRVDEDGLSIDEIIAMTQKRRKEEQEREAAEKAARDAEYAAKTITEITVTNVDESSCDVSYTIKYANGETVDTESNFDDDEAYNRMYRTLKKMDNKRPSDSAVLVAMLRQMYDSEARKPIRWNYEYKQFASGDDYWFTPSEDHLGHTRDAVDSFIRDGARVAESEDDCTTVNADSDGNWLYDVKLWWGAGYTLDCYQAYANSEEEALNYVVAYIEKTNPGALKGSDEAARETKLDIMKDKGLENEQEAEDTEEFQEQFMYVDATIEGAEEPHYVWAENMVIKRK